MDYTFTTIKEFWVGELTSFNETMLNTYDLPENTKTFLREVGLPSGNGRLNSVLRTSMLAFFYQDLSQIKKVWLGGTSYIALSEDPGVSHFKICLEEATGKVVAIDEILEYPSRLINTNIVNLLIFFQIYLQEWYLYRPIPEGDVALNILSQIRTKFLDIDEPALQDEDGYWNYLLETLTEENSNYVDEEDLDEDSE